MIARNSWSAEAENGMLKALGQEIDFIRQEVESGVSALWSVGQGWVVTRAEGDELVIVALENCDLKNTVPQILERAKKQGFKTVRCHTKRRSLERYLLKWGVTRREIILEANL
jgi:hypothetical protein